MRTAKSKILPLPRLLKTLKTLRRNPDHRIVFTNGCFDLLHLGHVTYLERAKKLGTHLIVALNSDSSVRRLKGPTRPIHSLSDRMQIIAALECVDFVTSFSTTSVLPLIQKLNPDLLVKGGDYSGIHEIVGAEWVTSHGGTVKILPESPGRSTTKTLKKIQT